MKQPYSRHGDCLTTDIIFNRQNQHSNRQMNPQNKESTTGANLQPADLQMKVTTDYNVWKLFFQGSEYQKEHRYSKAEAYFDLVNRQRLALLTEDDSYINGGILALAHAWSWDRTTVKKFIDSLCANRAATVTPVGNKSIIRLTNVSFLSHQDGLDK